MCQFKSGIAVRIDDSEVAVKVLPLNDSHTDILDKHYVRGCTLGLSRYSTPVELIPTKLDFDDKSCWTLVFDDRKPDWWTDGMTEQCMDQLLKAAKADFDSIMKGEKYNVSLMLDNLTSLPKGFNPATRFSLYLKKLTSIPEGFSPKIGNDLHMPSLTSIPAWFNPKVRGNLHLEGVRQLPKLFHPRVRGKIYYTYTNGLMSTPSLHLSPLRRLIRACLYHISNTIQEGWC